MATKTLGKNIEYSVVGNKLTLVIDTSKEFGMSGSGKTIIVATTGGNQDVAGIKLGLNAYKYPDAKPGAKAKK